MKTLLIGILLFSATASAAAKNTGTSGGRFQVIQLSDMRRDQVLIDSQTGKTWRMACLVSAPGANAGDCEYGAWMLEDAEGINKSKADIYKESAEIRKLMTPEPAK